MNTFKLNLKRAFPYFKNAVLVLGIALSGWYAREFLGAITLQETIIILAIVILSLTAIFHYRIRRHVSERKDKEEQAVTLYHLSKDLAAAVDFEEVLEIVRTNISKIFNSHVAIFLLSDE